MNTFNTSFNTFISIITRIKYNNRMCLVLMLMYVSSRHVVYVVSLGEMMSSRKSRKLCTLENNPRNTKVSELPFTSLYQILKPLVY